MRMPRFAHNPLLIIATLLAIRPIAGAQNGHAHNDYQHPRPLRQALANGFRSLEIDIYLQQNELRVAHFPWQTHPSRTLASLYLQPLQSTFARDTNQREPAQPMVQETPIRLLIDCKTEGTTTYEAVMAEIAQYPELFAPSIGLQPDSNGQPLANDQPVYVVFSGKCRGMCPRDAAANIRIEVGDTLNAETANADSLCPIELMSLKWSRYFDWNGRGQMPETERTLLRYIVSGRFVGQLRLYGAPDTPEAWEEFSAANVPWINTDKLEEFARWRQRKGNRTP